MDGEKHPSKMTSEELIEQIEAMMKKRRGVRVVGELAVIYEKIKAKYAAKRARLEAEAKAKAADCNDEQIDSGAISISHAMENMGAEA